MVTRRLWPLFACAVLCAGAHARSYARIEASFALPELAGNPFDHTANDVRVVVTDPAGGQVSLPAFYDGGSTWRVRHTPSRPGRHTLGPVTRQGQPLAGVRLEPAAVDVAERPVPGFVRLDPRDGRRFADEDGQPYYPLGLNIAWATREHDVPWFLDRLAAAGGNWSRIWMCHWGLTNLDWVPKWSALKKPAPGELSLEVARTWDRIVNSAEAGGIRCQLTLQHHGQYSSRTDPAWGEHPWSQKNGGWLPDAGAFFTDSRAIALTRQKYRYIIARWGCSPAILAWELFNEVQYVDAYADQHPEAVAAWHREMAAFLRAQDPYHHLVCTSSDLELPGIWDVADYYQPHAYPSDLVPVLRGLDERRLPKPCFLGEMGPRQGLDQDRGGFLHRALWASLMSEAAGAAQYWTWDTVARFDLWPHFRAAASFVRASNLASRGTWRRLDVGVTTAQSAPVRFSPGGGWGDAKQTEFTVQPDGTVAGLSRMPAYLHGQYHKASFPKAVFRVTYPAAGTFAVHLAQIARAGAKLVVTVDGQPSAEQVFAAAAKDTATQAVVSVPVPAGAHTVTLENTGLDWLVLAAFELSPYGPAIEALGKGGPDGAVFWLASRLPAQPVTGTLTVPGLAPGPVQVTWWDTRTGTPASRATAAATAAGLRLDTPPVSGDAAVTVGR